MPTTCARCRCRHLSDVGSAEAVFRRPSGSAGAFAIKVDAARSSLDTWPLTSRLASPLATPGSNGSDASDASDRQRDGSAVSSGDGGAAAAAAEAVAHAAFEADLEAEIWAAEALGGDQPVQMAAVVAAAAAAGEMVAETTSTATAAGCSAAGPAAAGSCLMVEPAATTADTQEAVEAAVSVQRQWSGLRFADAATESQFVQWHGLQAQKVGLGFFKVFSLAHSLRGCEKFVGDSSIGPPPKALLLKSMWSPSAAPPIQFTILPLHTQMDGLTLVILLVMWCALGLPPMGLWWKSSPLWTMYALGALWAAAFFAHQRHPIW